MRGELTRGALRELMAELARTAPTGKSFQVHVVGGGTAVLAGWRAATIDADLYAEDEAVFRDVPRIKERLRVNVEFVRPEHFVPALEGSAGRHLLIERMGDVEFFHYDPYAQLLSKVVRGFRKDMLDAENFIRSGMVDPSRFRALVAAIPDSGYLKYPQLDRAAVESAVDRFLSRLDSPR